LRGYLEVCKSRDLRDTTITGYKASIDKHIIPAFGKTMLLAELQPSHLQTLLYGKMLADGFASRTIELAHVVLHAALEQAVVEGKLYRNVADAVVPPRPRRKKIHRTLKPEEVEPMLAYMRKADKRMYHFGALCVYTGLSRSEMLAEEWGDIDLPNAVLRVTKGVTVTEKVFTVAGPKTEQRTREVPLLKEALKVLCEMKREATCKLLFHEDGHHLNPGTVSKRFTKLAAEAGYPGITPHKLRHTFATNMLRAGVSIKHVQVLMGHSSIKTTGDIYAHVIEDDLRDAVNTYGDSLRKKPSAPIRHQADSN
jgi:integrase